MHIRDQVVGTAVGILTLASAAGSATAADWQALQSVAATPMTPAQMEAVQGKFTFDQKVAFVSGSTGFAPNVYAVGNGTITLIASRSGVSVATLVQGSGPAVLTYTPPPAP